MSVKTINPGGYNSLYPTLWDIPWEIQDQMTKSSMRLYEILTKLHRKSFDSETGKTNCKPSYKYLAEVSGLCIRTIHNAIHNLEALGLFRHIHRFIKATKRYATNLYYVPKIVYQTIRRYWSAPVVNNTRVQKSASVVVKLLTNTDKTPELRQVRGVLPIIKESERQDYAVLMTDLERQLADRLK